MNGNFEEWLTTLSGILNVLILPFQCCLHRQWQHTAEEGSVIRLAWLAWGNELNWTHGAFGRRGRWARVLKCSALTGQKLFTPVTRRLLWLSSRINFIDLNLHRNWNGRTVKCTKMRARRAVQAYLRIKMRTQYAKCVQVGRSVICSLLKMYFAVVLNWMMIKWWVFLTFCLPHLQKW